MRTTHSIPASTPDSRLSRYYRERTRPAELWAALRSLREGHADVTEHRTGEEAARERERPLSEAQTRGLGRWK
jgi:hypothetical protein